MPNAGKPMDDQTNGPPKRNVGEDSTQTGPITPPEKIEGSMHTEEPTGWDLAPQDIKDPQQKRHPRPDGEGGIRPANPPVVN